MDKNKVQVLEGQSLLDIAIQTAGSVEAAFDIAQQNGISATDELHAGQELEMPEPIARRIVGYYEARGIKPATVTINDDLGRVFFEEMPIEFE